MNRRDILKSTTLPVVGAVAGASVALPAMASAALAELINRHIKAAEEYTNAAAEADRLSVAYRATRGEGPHVPILLGGSVSLVNGEERTRAWIVGAYEKQRQQLGPLSRVSPDLARQVRETMNAKQDENLALFDRAIEAETAERETFGLSPAERRFKDANETEEAAALALCAYRCVTIEEARQKADYLARAGFGLSEEQAEALVGSGAVA